MVFQQYTSFEWKTVLQNVALPLILKGVPKDEANDKAMDMIKVVGLAGHENKWAKYPILVGWTTTKGCHCTQPCSKSTNTVNGRTIWRPGYSYTETDTIISSLNI